ncbi:MAG: adenylate kinase [Acetobacteraceae bacterium]|nr:adenylate kinase [Acetobacteraceae bacterium]
MRVVFMGPPGAGKGTQAVELARRQGVPHLSLGDMLRQAAAEGSELGLRAREFMERGALVPDQVVVGLVEERLGRPDCQAGFVLDGFPRTLAQAEALERILARQGRGLDAVLNLEVDDESLVERLVGRRVCRRCGQNYHLRHRPPRRDEVCDVCGGELYQREDDREETVRRRLEVHRANSAPILGLYRAAGLLRAVDGRGGVEEVAAAVSRAVGEGAGP